MRCSSLLAVCLAGVCFIASSVFQSHRASAASEFTAGQKTDIEKIIHDYLLSKPEVLKEAIDELDKRQKAAEALSRQKAVNENADKIFNSQNQAVVGNPAGDVTLVEFFDYNCGYCKKSSVQESRRVAARTRLP